MIPSPQFVVTNVVTIFIPLWGMIGIWTQKFGYEFVKNDTLPYTDRVLPGFTMYGSFGKDRSVYDY